MRIAIIGAGMAGAACAQKLTQNGVDVELFDKGRSVGGRMAQRRRDGAIFDHGAQFFTARDPEFLMLARQWRERGLVANWGLTGRPDEEALIGVPAMSIPVKELLGARAVRTGCRITALLAAEGAWLLRDDDGAEHGPFDRVVLAVPQPQALELLRTTRHGESLAARIQDVVMAPCWAGLLAFDHPVSVAVGDNAEVDHPVLRWAARNPSKPGREGLDAWTIHARSDWSRAVLEERAEDIAPRLAAAFFEVLGVAHQPCRYVAAHRWRYAFVERALGSPCADDPSAGLSAIGDWCLGPRVEAAFMSGSAAAEVLAKNHVSA